MTGHFLTWCDDASQLRNCEYYSLVTSNDKTSVLALTGCNFASCFFGKDKVNPVPLTKTDAEHHNMTVLRSLISAVDLPDVPRLSAHYAFKSTDVNSLRCEPSSP